MSNNTMANDWRTAMAEAQAEQETPASVEEFFKIPDAEAKAEAEVTPATTANDKAKEALQEVKKAVSKKPLTNVDKMKAMFNSPAMMKQVANALPKCFKGNEERYIRGIMTNFSLVPKLADCEQSSLLGSLMTMVQLGLDPSPAVGECYILPYTNRRKGIIEAQFILSYKGLMQLAYRAGVRKITAHTVKANDKFCITYGLREDLIHEPKMDGDRGEAVGYYATVTLPNGDVAFKYMTKSEIKKHADTFSKQKMERGSVWYDHFDAMAKKTVVKQVLKFAPISAEFTASVQKDEGIISVSPEKVSEVRDVFDTVAEFPEEDK